MSWISLLEAHPSANAIIIIIIIRTAYIVITPIIPAYVVSHLLIPLTNTPLRIVTLIVQANLPLSHVLCNRRTYKPN